MFVNVIDNIRVIVTLLCFTYDMHVAVAFGYTQTAATLYDIMLLQIYALRVCCYGAGQARFIRL